MPQLRTVQLRCDLLVLLLWEAILDEWTHLSRATEAAVKKKMMMFLVGLKEPNNYLETNVQYFSGTEEADVKERAADLILKRGFASVMVMELKETYHRSIEQTKVVNDRYR